MVPELTQQAFRYELAPTPAQDEFLNTCAGASRFWFNQALALVKTRLDERAAGPTVRVPWSYETLLDAIVTGALPPGERIRDAELAEQLETSRMPVREALKRLEAEGLVETVPNRETRVAPIRAERAAQAFPVIAALHGLGTRLGVPALTAADDEGMRSLDRERARALKRGDVIAAIELDDAFHGVLLEAAGNDELIRALERLMPQIRRLDALHFKELTRRDPSADHAEILDACARRDADEAARLVEANYLRLGAQMATVLGDG